MTRRRLQLALALAAALLYLPTLSHPLVYGDLANVIANRSIRDLGNWRWIVAGSSRPLTNFTYAIAWALSGARPWAHHALNIFFHALNVLLAFAAAGVVWDDASRRARVATDEKRRTVDEKRRTVAQALAAGLLAAHPLMTEAVGYVNARAGLMAATFGLLAFLSLRRAVEPGRRARFIFLGLAAWVCGLACKESAAMWPLVFLFYDRWLLDGDRRRLWRFHAPILFFTVAAGVARLLTFQVQGGNRPDASHLMTEVVAFWKYARLMALPVGQSLMHEVAPVRSPFDARFLVSAAALIACALGLARLRSPLPRLGAAWFALLLLPSSALPLGETMAEHRVYEGALGIFLVAGVLLAARPPRALAALLIALAALTALRNQTWTTPVRLWSDAAARAPGLWQPHYALGDALREDGRCPEAVREYERAFALRPSEARIALNLGICFAQLRRFDAAEQAIEWALRVNANDPGGWLDLGLVELELGRRARAREHLLEAARLRPTSTAALLGLARAADDPQERARRCDEARALDPAAAARLDECRPPR